MKNVWLIVIDNHNSDPEYIICGSEKMAERKFEETVRDRYVHYTDEQIEEELSEAVSNGFYESSMGDTLIILMEPLYD